jgi:hypothetical protein
VILLKISMNMFLILFVFLCYIFYYVGHNGSVKGKNEWGNSHGLVHNDSGLSKSSDSSFHKQAETSASNSSGSRRRRDSLEGTGTKTKDTIQLEKRLGLFSGVALIVGTMIGKWKNIFDLTSSLLLIHLMKKLGSGIFVSPSGLLVRTGSVGISFIIWMACGLLSLLGEFIKRLNFPSLLLPIHYL